MSADKQLDKGAHTYYWHALLSHRKEPDLTTYHSMDGPGGVMLSGVSQRETNTTGPLKCGL